MSEKDACDMLVEINNKMEENGDYETAHMDADNILCQLLTELGYTDVVETYKKINKYYS